MEEEIMTIDKENLSYTMFMQRDYSLKAQNQTSDIRESISINRYGL